MINLLPDQRKKEIAAGRINVILWRYCMVSLLLGMLLFAITGVFYAMLLNTRNKAIAENQESQQKIAAYRDTQQQFNTLKKNIAVAKTILSKDISYSKLAITIGQAIPSGIVLQSLDLNAANFGKPTTLNAMGRSYDDALRLKSSLEASPIFHNVHIESVSQAETTSKATYTTAIVMSVVIKPGDTP